MGVDKRTVRRTEERVEERCVRFPDAGGVAPPPPASLVKTYKMDGTDTNLTFTGGQDKRLGKVGPDTFSNFFDGSTQYADIDADSSLFYGAENGFSLSFWLRQEIQASGTVIFSTGNASAGMDGFLASMDGGGQLILNSNGTFAINTTGPVLDLGAWHHCVITYYNGSAIFYIDGVKRDTVAITLNTITGSVITKIGIGSAAAGARTTGNIDDLRYYTGVLTQAEVTTRFNDTNDYAPSDGPTPTAWHDASNGETVTASSDRVSLLEDLAASRDLEQSTGADQPLTNSVKLNGMNGLFFDGVTEYLSTASDAPAILLEDITLVMVGRIYNDTVSNMAFMGASADTAGVQRGQGWKFTQRSIVDYRFSITDNTTNIDSTLTTNVFDATKSYMFSNQDDRINNNTISETRFVDGTLEDTINKSGADFNSLTETGPLTWAAVDDGSSVNLEQKMDFFESVYIIGDLDASNRQKIEGYLAWKWGTDADLPGGHPYKTVAPTA